MHDWVNFFESDRRNIYRECGRNRRLIDLIIKNTPNNGRILEAGCGTALMSIILSDYGYHVTALDNSVQVLEFARKKIIFHDLKLDFVHGDILNLSNIFPKKHFDTVCHSGVMEHFTDEDIVKGFSEQRMISHKVVFKIPNARTKRGEGLFGDERLMSTSTWMKLLRKSGFLKISCYGDIFDLPRVSQFILPNVFFSGRGTFWWKWFSSHTIFICEG
jgi:SAM-dependent methyltransferase